LKSKKGKPAMQPRRRLRLVSIVSTAGAVLLSANTASKSCDTWVALPDATADHSVILAKNSDRPPMEAQPLVQFPRRRHAAGDMVQCTCVRIPQAAQTHEFIGSKIWWAFGCEHGMNECGVAIGNEAVWSKEPYQWGDGLLGMDLLRLALERGDTACKAMHVMTGLLEKYGQCGDAEREGQWGKANYHNSFIIADPKEAWVLETAGRYWAAKKVAHGVYSISNIYSIERDFDESHPNLVRHAVEMGWTRTAQDFNFARDYGSYWTEDAKAPGEMQDRRNATLGCLRKDCPHVSPASMAGISRSHHEGTVLEPRWGAADAFWSSPCMHDSPHSRYRTSASMIAHLRADVPPLLRQVYWACFGNPCCGVFQPFCLHGGKVPQDYALGTSTYSADSPWWSAARVKLLCDLNYQALNPRVREAFDPTEAWVTQRQTQCESQILQLIHDGKEDAAVAHVQRLVDENHERIRQQYDALNKTLPTALKSAGIQYLYADYLKSWISQSKVPLPAF
jgi:dipeptidase